MRIFALEYIRQRLSEDEVHFVVAKKKSQFKLKAQVGPFICNTRVVGEEENRLLKEIKFSLIFTWSYDAMGVISRLRVENKFTPYHHTARPEIKQYRNQDQWQENTLQEAKGYILSTTTS